MPITPTTIDITAMLASTVPNPEEPTAAPGSALKASRGDHVHARLSETTPLTTLGSGGDVTLSFAKLYDAMPFCVPLLVEAGSTQPVVFRIKSFTQDGNGKYNGCVVHGDRSQTIPQNLVSLLVGAVFNLFGGSAVGATFMMLVIKAST